jgi:aryl-alcohol dehydrogenase-like predicted oxidoreductase
MTDASSGGGYAHPPSTIRLGDLEVQRLGYGAMRLPGEGVWGEPESPEAARRLLRRAVELGINFIDSAWFYGPFVAHRLICEALHPYPRDLVIATKLGGARRPDKSWVPAARPEELRQGAEHDLRTLKRERLDVVHLRYMPGSGVPLLESLDALIALQAEGKIRHLALSCVDAGQLAAALARAPIVAVQNVFSAVAGGGAAARYTHSAVADPEEVIELCEQKGIAYLPFFPLAAGNIAQEKPELAAIARRHEATPAQIALAWLLARSPVMLPIPGTSSPLHLEENWAARRIALSAEEMAAISPARG